MIYADTILKILNCRNRENHKMIQSGYRLT